jgi:hypothetical protein
MNPKFQELSDVLKIVNRDKVTHSEMTDFFNTFVKAMREVKLQMSKFVVENRDEVLKKLNVSITEMKIVRDKLSSEFNDLPLEEIRGIAQKVARDLTEMRTLSKAIPDIKPLLKQISMLRASIPTIEDIENDLPKLGTQVRNALELLRGEDRLNVSAIDGVDEMFKEIKKLIAAQNKLGSISVRTTTGSSSGVGAWSTPAETPDGIITVFTVGGSAPTDVSSDGVLLFEGVGYTYAAGQITLSNAPTQSVRYR